MGLGPPGPRGCAHCARRAGAVSRHKAGEKPRRAWSKSQNSGPPGRRRPRRRRREPPRTLVGQMLESAPAVSESVCSNGSKSGSRLGFDALAEVGNSPGAAAPQVQDRTTPDGPRKAPAPESRTRHSMRARQCQAQRRRRGLRRKAGARAREAGGGGGGRRTVGGDSRAGQLSLTPRKPGRPPVCDSDSGLRPPATPRRRRSLVVDGWTAARATG